MTQKLNYTLWLELFNYQEIYDIDNWPTFDIVTKFNVTEFHVFRGTSLVIESVHIIFCKYLLGVNNSANNAVAIGVCGRLPLCVTISQIA